MLIPFRHASTQDGTKVHVGFTNLVGDFSFNIGLFVRKNFIVRLKTELVGSKFAKVSLD